MKTIPSREYQRRYDLIAAHHLAHYRETGANPWMGEEPMLRAWTVGHVQALVSGGSYVLDAGSGIGLMLQDLHAGYHAVGIELAPEYVEHAKSLGLDARVGDIERIDLDDDTFDAAVCCDTLEHVQDPVAVVNELHRVVCEGGVLVVRVPDGDETGVGTDCGFGFPVHLHQWDEAGLLDLLGGESLLVDRLGVELLVAVRL